MIFGLFSFSASLEKLAVVCCGQGKLHDTKYFFKSYCRTEFNYICCVLCTTETLLTRKQASMSFFKKEFPVVIICWLSTMCQALTVYESVPRIFCHLLLRAVLWALEVCLTCSGMQLISGRVKNSSSFEWFQRPYSFHYIILY